MSLVESCQELGALLAALELTCEQLEATGRSSEEALQTLRDHAAVQLQIIESALEARRVSK